MLQRKWRCIVGTINSEIFARQESMVRYLLLESDPIEPVDKFPARNRIPAKVSVPRRNLAEQALYLAPYHSFTCLAAGHNGLPLKRTMPAPWCGKGNRFTKRRWLSEWL
jgi:hypothetical protein